MADGADITVDVSDLLAGLRDYDKQANLVEKRVLRKHSLDVEREAKALSPISFPKGGRLMRSGHAEKPKEDGNGWFARVGFNTPYAAKVHELMWPAISISFGRSGGGTAGMMPGKTTRERPATRFGEAGGKYLERPLLGLARELPKTLAKRLKRMKAKRRRMARR